jgi:predicted metal-dependent enzyme (double-stranded beta helix superfamily)
MAKDFHSRLVADANSAARQPDPARALAALVRELVGSHVSITALVNELPGRGEAETLLFASSRLTLLRVEIEPGVQYPPHDHRMPAVIGVLEAAECNTYYQADGDVITPIEEVESRAGDVVQMSKDVVHAVSNRGDTRSVALHAYPGDLFGMSRIIWDPLTGQRFPYTDERYFALARLRGAHPVDQ